MTVESNRKLFSIIRWPLIFYGILSAIVVFQSNYTWFTWHPFCMTLAFITIAGNAIMIKKIGGYSNTKIHGNMMFAASVLAGLGWYVIHTNKNIQKKAHLTTPHGKLGVLVILSYFGLFLVGAVFLNPDFGILKSNNFIRSVHKYSGRVVTALAWVTCMIGLSHIVPDTTKKAALFLPLLVLGYYVLR